MLKLSCFSRHDVCISTSCIISWVNSMSEPSLSCRFTCAMYYLLRHPIWIDRIRQEISPYPNMEISELRDLPVLNAIIHETLRLRPAVPGKSPRYTPSAGLMVAGQFVPGNVNVFVPQSAVMTDKRYFSPSPLGWRPERWLEPEKEEAMDIKACLLLCCASFPRMLTSLYFQH